MLFIAQNTKQLYKTDVISFKIHRENKNVLDQESSVLFDVFLTHRKYEMQRGRIKSEKPTHQKRKKNIR